MSGSTSSRFGAALNTPRISFSLTSSHSGKPTWLATVSALMTRPLVARLFTNLHHVAGLHLVRRDRHRLAIDLHGLVAHQLACLGARDRETHAIDDVVQPALEQLQQRLAGGAGYAGQPSGNSCGTAAPARRTCGAASASRAAARRSRTGACRRSPLMPPGGTCSLHLVSSGLTPLLRNRSVPSRRESLHLGPIYRAILYLRRAASWADDNRYAESA